MTLVDPDPPDAVVARDARLGDRLFHYDHGNVFSFRSVEEPHVVVRLMNGTRLAFESGIRYWTRDGVSESQQTTANVVLPPEGAEPATFLALEMNNGDRVPLRQLCPFQYAWVIGPPTPQQIAEQRRREAAQHEREARRSYAALRAWATALAAEQGREHPIVRSLELLGANLSVAQRAQFAESLCFEVIGGASGKRYRIKYGAAVNVVELGSHNEAVAKLCFAPRGDLPIGDVMLAQKTALELFEPDVLKIAGHYTATAAHLISPADFSYDDDRPDVHP